MLQATSALFALLTGVAGWHYLFFSRAATPLAGIAEQRLNDQRLRLRRSGGAVIGGVGASGGTVEQDQKVVEAAVSMFSSER